MSKLSQLQTFKKLGLPTPDFIGLSWRDFQNNNYQADHLRFPVAVRSTYREEDGDTKSYAGHFETKLRVSQQQLETAIEEVFASYPEPEDNEVIIQEMIEPDFSGVLFAFRQGVWKLELVPGLGEQLVAGQQTPKVLLLPRFRHLDYWLYPFWKCWKGLEQCTVQENRALVALSVYTSHLLAPMTAPNGLDVEFAIADGKLFLLQARPITTPEEAEQVLTSANHKEILPPVPSRFMTSLTSQSGDKLFDYYRSLDPSLPKRSFIEKSGEMPWINLSALLDMMVHWGLPTRLVIESVGAEDVYRVKIRPYVMLGKLPVFFRALWQQWRSLSIVEEWMAGRSERVRDRRATRSSGWQTNPGENFRNWLLDFQALYVDLVTHMQRLTGTMSGPMNILQRLGWLGAVTAASKEKSASMDYLQAIAELQYGNRNREDFLQQFGHRGFYESDLGQPRFREYSEADWEKLFPQEANKSIEKKPTPPSKIPFWVRWIARRMLRAVHMRERLRHETMKHFWSFRKELLEVTRKQFGASFSFWEYTTTELAGLFDRELTLEQLAEQENATPSGWDMDTFLSNRLGRRLPVSTLSNVTGEKQRSHGIGIFPGKVHGQVWRVNSASLSALEKPNFEKVILVADALDPGWMPYFTQVDGVISYIGGLLSHASIVLREYGVPSITQLPPGIVLQTGDWIEMDGATGKIRIDEEYAADLDQGH